MKRNRIIREIRLTLRLIELEFWWFVVKLATQLIEKGGKVAKRRRK